MKKTYTVATLALLFLLYSALAESAVIHLRGERLSVRDGLLGNTVNSVIQDDDGFMIRGNSKVLSFAGMADANDLYAYNK